MTEFRSLIFVEAQVNAQLDLVHARLIELEIGGRCVNGIAAEDDERLDAIVVNVADEISRAPTWLEIPINNGLLPTMRYPSVSEGIE